MSHSKEREEKICLNCSAHLIDRYCQHCGQENTEPKETFWTLISHFFNDITHFDGKFFSTGKYLLTKPGFLSAEYIKGRRASYLHPIRMYVFTSAFFFIIFFSLYKPAAMIHAEKTEEEQLKELTQASTSLKETLPEIKNDPAYYAATQRAIAKIDSHALSLKTILDAAEKTGGTKTLKEQIMDSVKQGIKNDPLLTVHVTPSRIKSDSVHVQNKGPISDDIDFGEQRFAYHSQLAYDSVQKELPKNKKAGWFERSIASKIIILNTKFKDDKKEGFAAFFEKFLHTLPQALFVSLPLFALLLLGLYARRSFYYADHAIFTIHLYCATFITMLFLLGIDKLASLIGMDWSKMLQFLFMVGISIYLYKAMRRFYGQGRGKTILKFFLLNIAAIIVVMTLAGLFFMLSVINFS